MKITFISNEKALRKILLIIQFLKLKTSNCVDQLEIDAGSKSRDYWDYQKGLWTNHELPCSTLMRCTRWFKLPLDAFVNQQRWSICIPQLCFSLYEIDFIVQLSYRWSFSPLDKTFISHNT